MMPDVWISVSIKMSICFQSISQVFGFLCLSLQSKLDALWVLLKKGYDRVSVMRPHPGDKVGRMTPVGAARGECWDMLLKHWDVGGSV